MARLTADPLPAIPSVDPAPLPASIAGSSRRILWIVGLFRAVCGALLLGLGVAARSAHDERRRAELVRHRRVALLRVRPRRVRLDPAGAHAAAAGADAARAAGGRHLFHRADDGRRRIDRRAAADPAVSAARRERLAAAHADGVLSRGAGGDRAAWTRGVSRDRRRRRRSAAFPDGADQPRLFRDGRHRSRSSAATRRRRRTSPRSAASTSRISSR